MKSLVIIPAYNEEKSIEKVIQDIRENAPFFDYIIINDCSIDATQEVCKKNRFSVLNLPVNLGIGGAVQTGYMYALRNGYDIAVQFDGDGQHMAEYLPTMQERLVAEKLNMIIGSRFLKKEGFQSTGMRRFGIRFFTGLIRLLTGKQILDPTSGMRMVDRETMKYFASHYPKDYPEPESVVTLLKQDKRVEEFPVIMRDRETGVSSISPVKSIYYMVKVTLAILVEKVRGV